VSERAQGLTPTLSTPSEDEECLFVCLCLTTFAIQEAQLSQRVRASHEVFTSNNQQRAVEFRVSVIEVASVDRLDRA